MNVLENDQENIERIEYVIKEEFLVETFSNEYTGDSNDFLSTASSWNIFLLIST